ncbi:hypothetical protein MHC_02820 [Mycoplasma haemocanis str. Illinois]|uniref:Uncharacterized protein n=1 Tax=Mycoplasma haemocanis (strain Illinois) TaxID=1111676 RepID=H6N704_MYCHN|nr:hypothetical protein [Mycoplasma haemocanis]AEW45426.1 hypothetical protein MHC_02820 [Mycoplasma haemocanis str. Illinois]
MAIGKFPVIGIVSLGTAGMAGGGYWVLNNRDNKAAVKEEDLKGKYKLAVLVTEEDWNKKFEQLKKENTAPTYEPLKAAYAKKDQDAEAKTLHRKACEDVYRLPKTVTDNLSEFAKYCFFNNLDKAETGKSLVTEKSEFQNKWDTFKTKQESELSPELVDALKNKGSVNTDSNWQEKMVAGCKALSEKIYEGDNKDFKDFCIKP